MKQRTLQILYTYWNGLRAGRIAPQRLEIDPSRIGAILPEIFLLERMDPATYCYRLAGTRLCEIFGSELRGTNLLDGWTAPDRATLAADLALTCERGAALHLVLEASADTTRRVQLEVILLPLSHADNAIGRVIGAMSAIASPHWLGHDHLRDRRLVSHESIWPDGRPNRVISGAGLLEPPLNTASAGARRNFRVLDGGRKED
ncbi:MAG TPA: PAS domain-containing protein [Hyphomicrobiaceae bacterium]|nr:PAS domain-containing protein [Hyphomicrobiaceae bacterium]